ncbi:MAG: transporter [Chlorobiales bacterium]|nr:transporter [Chlorobiales bacterium]
MTNSLPDVLAFALIPVAAAILGATIAAFRPPNSTVRSYIQHLAAGVVFSIVSVELLPEIMHRHAPMDVAIGFAAGVIVMLGIKSLTEKLETAESGHNKEKAESPVGMLVAVGVDVLLDGFLIGISFGMEGKGGKLLTIALTIELLSLGLAVATSLGRIGMSRMRIITTTASVFLLLVVGAAIGTVLLNQISSSAMETLLSFGLAALLYLVTEELLVEAHEEPETPLQTATFFGGFLLFLLLAMM